MLHQSSKEVVNTCESCNKAAGIFICRGCTKTFCLDHTHEHRKWLDKKMELIQSDHEHVKTAFDNTLGSGNARLFNQIDAWEQQSIKKINQIAVELRDAVSGNNDEYQKHFRQTFSELAESLSRAQQTGEFFEQDLQVWSENLKILRELLRQSKSISISTEKSGNCLIPKIAVSRSSDESVKNSSQYVYPDFDQYRSNRHLYSTGEYSSGAQSLRFKLERYETSAEFLIGIISAHSEARQEPSENKTFYGWSNNNEIYLHGIPHAEKVNDSHKNQIQSGDIFQLNLLCEKRMISLINERTQRFQYLEIDESQCAFPWRPYVSLLFRQ